MLQKLCSGIYSAFFGISISEEVRELKGEVVLHISDTPSTVYGTLALLIKALSPRWIIHTGDLADEVKLGLYPRELPRYRNKLGGLRSALQSHPEADVFIVTGNHDHEETVREFFSRSQIFVHSGRTELCGVGFNLSHERSMLAAPPMAYNLFGHEPGGGESCGGGCQYLNGLSNVHVISPSEGKVFRLNYPGYVKDGRLGRRKRGL